MKVFVYFNLHKKVWSVKALEGEFKGRVIRHTTSFTVTDCKFKVSEAGRQRVLRDKRKNVHAGIVGQWAGECEALPEWDAVSYNPYTGRTFYDTLDKGEVHSSPIVCGYGRKVVYY